MKNVGIVIVTLIGAFIILFVLIPMLLTAIGKFDIDPEKSGFKILFLCIQILIVVYFLIKGIKYFGKKKQN